MTGLDWLLVVVLLLAAAGGATRGLVASAAGFAGFAVGAVLGARFAPELLTDGTRNTNAPVAALAGAAILGTLVGGVLQHVGDRFRRRASHPAVVAVDATLGAVFTAALVVAAAWLVSAIALQAPDLPRDARSAIRKSEVLRGIRASLPAPDGALALLSRFDPLPGFDGPATAVGPPDPAVLRDPGVAVGRRGTVRIEGTACGVGVVGSGWVVAPGFVVTNQHVVAGEGDTSVLPAVGGGRLEATAVHVDPEQDIAILQVEGLDAPVLRSVRSPRSGTSGAILGYPLAGPFRARAARIGREETVSGEDAYGDGPVRRSVLPFNGRVEEGNSGGPLVDRRGRVLGTVFASSVKTDGRSGFAVTNDVVREAMADVVPGRAVDTGRCGH